MTKHIISSILLCALSTPAFAKPTMAPGSVQHVAPWLTKAKATGEPGAPSYDALARNANGVTKCMAELEGYRKDGDTEVYNDEFKSYGAKQDEEQRWVLTIDQAEDICREGERYVYVLWKDAAVIGYGNIDYDKLVQQNDSAEYVQQLIDGAKKCPAAVDAILAAKFEPSTPFHVGSAKTVGELKGMCEAGRKAGEKYLAFLDSQGKKAAAPYIKAGIKDDKLDLMLDYGGSVFLTGGAAPSDLKKYAAASVLFVWLTSDPDDAGYVVHTVRRFQFKGNRLVKTTEKTYRKPSGANLGGGAFK